VKLEFSIKYKDYEIRACPKRLARVSPDEINETIDFVKWSKDSKTGRDYCFSIAYFKRDSEGYYLHFVGRRPFDYIDHEDIGTLWELLKTAQGVLDNFFSLEELDND
jgi:hypothetical protein